MLPRSLRLPLALAAGSVAFLATSVGAEAATFTVNSTSDAAYNASTDSCAGGSATCTLRAAVQLADTAGGASTIAIPAGTYTLTIDPPNGNPGSDPDDPATGDLDVDSGATVTITGAGAGSTIVNANGVDRAFTVHTGAALSLSNMTIEGGEPASQSTGSGDDGGAVYTDGALSTSDVNFTNNDSPSYGAGIYATPASTLAVTGGVFEGNEAEYGGAIYDGSSSAASVQGAGFNGNGYDYGSGIYFYGTGSLSVTNSSFTNQTAYESGAGIYADDTGPLNVTGSSFTNDVGGDGGAGIYDDYSVLTATRDTFTKDSATYDSGGAVYLDVSGSVLNYDQFTDDAAADGGALYSGAQATVENSTFVGGSAEYGGGIYVDAHTTVTNDTLTDNSSVYGGGLYIDGSEQLGLTNDTIVGNTAFPGHGGGVGGTASATVGSGQGVVNTMIADNTGGDCDALFVSSEVTGYDLDSDSSCFGGLSAPGDQTGVEPLLAPFANNGGSVETVRELAGSPTIAAGGSADCTATDARGVARAASACDIGAYQLGLAGLTASNSAPSSITAGGQFSITLTGTDNGPSPATDLTVSDQLPSGLSLISATPASGTCTTSGTPADVVCDLGTVNSGASASVTLVVSAAAAGTLSNTATVTDNEGSTATSAAKTTVSAVATTTTTTTGAPSTTTTPGAPSTTPPPASVGSKPVTDRTRTGATLHAMITISDGARTAYFFQYGQSRSYGRTTAGVMTTESGLVSLRIKHLARHTRYYYRLVTVTDGQVTRGAQRSFVTMGRKAHKTRHHK